MNRTLNIGINNYPGTHNDLYGCVNDASAWSSLLGDKFKFDEVFMLLDGEATIANVKKEMSDIIATSKEGDSIVITYSGHGSNVPDVSGDELDGRDETWFLCDGNLLDDEIGSMLSRIPCGVKTTIISDSCHSGTITRALARSSYISDYHKIKYMPPEDDEEAATLSAKKVINRVAHIESKMKHIVLAGTDSKTYSYDAVFSGKPMGAYTYYATDIINKNDQMTYNELHTLIGNHLPAFNYPQNPQLEGPDCLKDSQLFVI